MTEYQKKMVRDAIQKLQETTRIIREITPESDADCACMDRACDLAMDAESVLAGCL
jgi:hypothetical protein